MAVQGQLPTGRGTPRRPGRSRSVQPTARISCSARRTEGGPVDDGRLGRAGRPSARPPATAVVTTTAAWSRLVVARPWRPFARAQLQLRGVRDAHIAGAGAARLVDLAFVPGANRCGELHQPQWCSGRGHDRVGEARAPGRSVHPSGRRRSGCLREDGRPVTKAPTRTNPDLEGCIDTTFIQFQFPEPVAAGIVIVAHPLVCWPGSPPAVPSAPPRFTPFQSAGPDL